MITKHRRTLWIEGVEDRRSMNEEAILERPSLAESRRCLEEQAGLDPAGPGSAQRRGDPGVRR